MLTILTGVYDEGLRWEDQPGRLSADGRSAAVVDDRGERARGAARVVPPIGASGDRVEHRAEYGRRPQWGRWQGPSVGPCPVWIRTGGEICGCLPALHMCRRGEQQDERQEAGGHGKVQDGIVDSPFGSVAWGRSEFRVERIAALLRHLPGGGSVTSPRRRHHLRRRWWPVRLRRAPGRRSWCRKGGRRANEG